jgi:UDP-N-acetylglucosamine--N-acetylmuramyl-(pentapeptide) pyrophosphoryl-undecaprenol N-acetylglucosamine transferase
VLLAGGGSGGHVFPALAVGEELARRGFAVSFTGAPQGIEARLVAERGLPFLPLPARPLAGRGPWRKLAALGTVARSTWGARRLIRERGVAAVVGTGGYVSAPAVLGARLARRPSLLVEPNARAGLANRWLSRWATAAAVAYEGTRDELQCPATVTGVPVRQEFFAVPAVEQGAAAAAPRLLVLGGSQGARQLNRALPPALARLERERPAEAARLSVLHQAGRALLEEARALYDEAGLTRVRVEVVPFIGDVAGTLAGVHLVLSRAGAITLAELAAAGRAVLLVPLDLAGGHQRHNALSMAEAGAGRVIDGFRLAPEPLAAALAALLFDPERLVVAGRAARALARPGAVAAIADRVAELAGVDTAAAGGEGAA